MSAFPTLFFRPSARRAWRFVLAAPLGLLLDGYATPAMAQSTSNADVPAFEAPQDDNSLTGPVLPSVNSPMRVSISQEASYKVAAPDHLVKNRSTAQLEYSEKLLDKILVQFNGKASVFLAKDHRHEAEGTDVSVSQAFMQSSFGKTSVKAGIQTLPWGESISTPITDEVSPRDNRELFNFNIEELRIGQAMVTVDQYADSGRWSLFWNPKPSFNKNPKKGTANFFDPFNYRARIEGDRGAEYGASWRKNFESFDISFIAASLIDNEYALRMNSDATVTRVKERFTMTGLVYSHALKNFVIRAELAVKSPKAYNDAALQIVKKTSIEAYFGVDYRYNSSTTFGTELINQHIAGWTSELQGMTRNRQSLLLTMTKQLMNDDLTVTVQHFHNTPYRSDLSIVQTSFKWDDHVTLGMNVVYPHANDQRSGLFLLRDEKQIAFKFQYQF